MVTIFEPALVMSAPERLAEGGKSNDQLVAVSHLPSEKLIQLLVCGCASGTRPNPSTPAKTPTTIRPRTVQLCTSPSFPCDHRCCTALLGGASKSQVEGEVERFRGPVRGRDPTRNRAEITARRRQDEGVRRLPPRQGLTFGQVGVIESLVAVHT